MASKNIKGITIEIGGNTTKLQDALKSVDKTVYNLNSDLKNLNQALKLDPSNVSLISQKYDVLKRNIDETKTKINTLKEAQRQMGAYSKLTDEQKSSYNALSLEIAKSENALKNMNNQLKLSNNIDLSKVQSALSGITNVALKAAEAVVKVSTAVGTALAGVVAAGVKSYAELEQNIGGVETLFKKDADKVIANAKQAYKTAGVSANEYMAGVTSFSASLLQSLGNNTAKAADVADMAFRDMSDNANKFGTDMSSIQNAYQGFAKQQYQLLDNLKLGYGGTKTEMERLLADAEKISGVKYDISNLSDVYNAIHVIQNELGVTGTTAEEAEKTISGSFISMKAALDNFLNGTGDASQLSTTFTNFMKNIVEAVKKLAPDILKGITELMKTLIPEIGSLLVNLLPELAKSVQSFIDTLFKMIEQDNDGLIEFVFVTIDSLIGLITKNLPKFVDAGLKLIISLAQGLVDNIPYIIQSITSMLSSMIDSIIENLPMFIGAALDLIVALAEGLVTALPELIDRVPDIIASICETLLRPDMIEKIVESALRLIVALGGGLISAIPTMVSMLPRIILAIVDSLKTLITKTDWGALGKDIGKGVLNGVANIGDFITKKVKEVKDKIVKKFKEIFDIHSPSRLMKKEIGFNIVAGVGEGIEDGIPNVLDDVKSAMVDLNNGIQASVNPIINPTANSNPLYLNIDKFYNNTDQDVQTLAEKLEFYRKQTATATGGN